MNPPDTEIPVLTIDGPSGTGKGTIAQRAAAALGWHLLDSGALYRLLALAARHQHIGLDDEPALAAAGRDLDVRFESVPGGEPRVLLNGDDVSQTIRTESVGAAASQVAALPSVRQALLARQRAFCQPPGLVADGRDMGTVVFPAAGVKIFLTASSEERARRRYKQLKDKGVSVNLTALSREIAARDQRDAQRSVAPLRPAADAVILDTTDLDIDQVAERVLKATRERYSLY